MTAPSTWVRDEQHTVLDLLRARVEASPDDPYLDVIGEALTAGEVSRSAARITSEVRSICHRSASGSRSARSRRIAATAACSDDGAST